MINPYTKKTVVVARSGNELSESKTSLNLDKNGRVEVGAGAFEDKHGEINAYTKKEVIQKQLALAASMNMGEITEQYDFGSKRAELVQAAIEDKSGETWRVVGEVMGDQVLETMGRDGFLRKLVQRKDLKKGEIGRVTIRKKDVLAFSAVDATGTTQSHVNQSYVLPDEFFIKAHILIDDRELEQAPGDLLDDKYIDALEQMMVVEDKVLKNMLDVAAPAYNDVIGFPTFTPSVFAQAATALRSWGNPAATAILSIDLMNDVLSDPEFSTYFDPVTKREVIMSGSIGSFFGVNLLTDGFRYDTLRVLNSGEFYFLSAPNVLGVQTVRKDLTVSPVNGYLIGRPERGWFMQKIMGLTLPNARAIVKGVRI